MSNEQQHRLLDCVTRLTFRVCQLPTKSKGKRLVGKNETSKFKSWRLGGGGGINERVREKRESERGRVTH